MTVSRSVCDNVRPFLSALVDGELEPLESIGVRRHIEGCAACRMELMALEQLKLRLHAAGQDAEPSELDRARWAAAVATRAADRRTGGSWRMPMAAAAAMIIGVLSLSVPSSHDARPVAMDVASAQVVLDHAALERIVSVHQGHLGHIALDDMVQAGALMTFEELPGTFIAPNAGADDGTRQASFADCDAGSAVGSALAVLRAARIQLPPEAQSALETSGVYVEVIGNTELRLTRGGEKLFVLLRPIEPVWVGSTI